MDNSMICENCKYWRPVYSDYGECHRNPPTVYSNSICSGLWPRTHYKEWCGNFEQKVINDGR